MDRYLERAKIKTHKIYITSDNPNLKNKYFSSPLIDIIYVF